MKTSQTMQLPLHPPARPPSTEPSLPALWSCCSMIRRRTPSPILRDPTSSPGGRPPRMLRARCRRCLGWTAEPSTQGGRETSFPAQTRLAAHCQTPTGSLVATEGSHLLSLHSELQRAAGLTASGTSCDHHMLKPCSCRALAPQERLLPPGELPCSQLVDAPPAESGPSQLDLVHPEGSRPIHQGARSAACRS